MPLNVFSALILIISTAVFGYYTLSPVFERVFHLSLVNFDILTYLSRLSFNFVLFDLDVTKIFIIGGLSLLGFFVIYLSHKYAEERLMKFGLKPVLAFLFLYFILIGVIWMGVSARLLAGLERTW
jgi:hypothetical protein